MTNPKHTSSDLVEWCSQDLPCARYQALEAEVERWKELLHRSADQIYSLTGDFGSEDNDLADEIRAALEARHD